MRSRSRVGYGDMGVNRARVEDIRAELKVRSTEEYVSGGVVVQASCWVVVVVVGCLLLVV